MFVPGGLTYYKCSLFLLAFHSLWQITLMVEGVAQAAVPIIKVKDLG